MMEERVNRILDLYCREEVYEEGWDLKGLVESVNQQFSLHFKGPEEFKEQGRDAIREQIITQVHEAYRKKEQEFGETLMRQLEKMVLLRIIDTHWKDHLLSMDYLKEGIGLRGYGQKDPLAEYKREGFEMFSGMMERIETDAIEHLFRVQVVRDKPPSLALQRPSRPRMVLNRSEGAPSPPRTVHRDGKKIGRNEPCPCGSGKKYKKCHGQ